MKTKLYIIISLVLLPLLASAQKAWTLQQCVDTAWANNRNIKKQALTKQSREIAYQQAKFNLLPDLKGSVSENWNSGKSVSQYFTPKRGFSLGLSSDITLFDGMKMKYEIDARKADMYASQADLEKIQSDIALSVSSAFLQVLLNKELVQISKEQLALSNTKITQRKALIASGKMAEGELLELVAQEAKEVQSKIQAENNLKLALLDLSQIMEINHFEDIDIEVPQSLMDSELKLLSAETVFESAISHRPEIKSAEYQLQSGENEVKIAKSSYYPNLRFGVSSGTEYNVSNNIVNESFGKQMSNNIMTRFGLSLSVPIFNKFAVKNNVRNAQISLQGYKLNMDNAKLELKKTIQQAYYNALGAKSRWEAALKSETASREAFRFTNEKYEVGRATSYELYQAKNNLTQVLSEQAQAKYEYVFRIKILELLK